METPATVAQRGMQEVLGAVTKERNAPQTATDYAEQEGRQADVGQTKLQFRPMEKLVEPQAKLGTQAGAIGPGGGQSRGVVHNGSALGQDRAPARGRALPLEGGVRLPFEWPRPGKPKGSRRGHNLF